jgi:hypothetical protein
MGDFAFRGYNRLMFRAFGLIAICCLGSQALTARADGTHAPVNVPASAPVSAPAPAPHLDDASTSALLLTQKMLQDPGLRNKAIGESSSAQTVDAQVKSLTGNPQATEELYKISGQVLEDLVKETGGDPVKMMQIMNQATSDPKGFFANHISEANKASIHDMSTQIENSPTTRLPATTPAP